MRKVFSLSQYFLILTALLISSKSFAADCSSPISSAVIEAVACDLPSGGLSVVSGGITSSSNVLNLSSTTSVGLNNAGSLIVTDNGATIFHVNGGNITGGIINSGVMGNTVGGGGFGIRADNATLAGGITNTSTGSMSVGNVYLTLINTTLTGGINNYGSIYGNWGFFSAQSSSVISGGFNNAAGATLGGKIFGFYLKSSTLNGGLNNSGTITTNFRPIFLDAGAIVNGGLNNSGVITNTGVGVSPSPAIDISAGATINGGITNAAAGSIVSVTSDAIKNAGSIDFITNNGSISAAAGFFGINNSGSINTLNNKQSNLTYTGLLPTNYNIIINSTSNFGKLVATSATGTTAFGIATGSTVSNNLYSSILSGVTSSQITNTSGTYSGYNWLLSLQSGSSTIWDLLFESLGPSAVDTQSSIRTSALRLRNIFNVATISTDFANMNTYDCNLFDAKGMCISAGGRYTTLDNPNSNNTSAVVVVGYKASPNIRIGGFLDRSVNNNTPTGIRVSNKNPLMGAFAVWNQNADGSGVQVKVVNAYQDKDVTATRDVIDTSEAGRGKTELNTQSYVGELSYAFTFKDKTLVRPYLALRHTTIKQDAYTEDTTVTVPLTYAALEDKSTAALLGIKLNHALTPKVNLTASLGVEQDLNHKVDQYAASGVSGLTSENFNDNIKHTRPVASLGAYYALTKTQRISGDVYYQQLPFQSTGSTTAYFNYTVGL